ncbi:hypothetical protein B2G74_00400 [Burkholderia sp. A27]|nr:hypothetical protein B2G74_00400 [Burkholderia sp. A27]
MTSATKDDSTWLSTYQSPREGRCPAHGHRLKTPRHCTRGKREWLDPVGYYRLHHSLLETVPQSILARARNFDAALRAISRYRCPPLRLSKTLR